MSLYEALVTIVGTIFVGYISKAKKIFNDSQIHAFEIFLFKVGMPCYLFSVTLKYDINKLFNVRFLLNLLLTFLLTFALGLIINRKHSISKFLTFGISSSYSNTSMYTTPVIFFIFGDPVAGVLANLFQVIFVQSSFLIILSCLNSGESVLQKIKKIFTTPLIIMPVLGIFLNYIDFKDKLQCCINIVDNLGKIATGLALFTFGLNFDKVKFDNPRHKKNVLKIIFIKNLIHPIFAFLIGFYVFKLEKYWLVSSVITASAPTAFVIYVIANEYKIDAKVVRIVVVLSSLISIMLLPIFILSFKAFDLL
jgi:malonate transporter